MQMSDAITTVLACPSFAFLAAVIIGVFEARSFRQEIAQAEGTLMQECSKY